MNKISIALSLYLIFYLFLFLPVKHFAHKDQSFINKVNSYCDLPAGLDNCVIRVFYNHYEMMLLLSSTKKRGQKTPFTSVMSKESPSLIMCSRWIFAAALSMLKQIVSAAVLDRKFPSSCSTARRRGLFLSGAAEPRAFLGESVWWRDSCVSDESAWGQRANVLRPWDWLECGKALWSQNQALKLLPAHISSLSVALHAVAEGEDYFVWPLMAPKSLISSGGVRRARWGWLLFFAQWKTTVKRWKIWT